jgi:hypothetical protein
MLPFFLAIFFRVFSKLFGIAAIKDVGRTCVDVEELFAMLQKSRDFSLSINP